MRDPNPPPEPPLPTVHGQGASSDTSLPASPPPTETSRHPPDIDLEPHDYSERHKPSFAERLFDIGWGGWLHLAALCVLAGVLIRAAGVNPFDRTFTWSGALQDLGAALVSLAGWVIANGWLPLLTGALVVIPLWLLWRLLSLPFRRSRDR